jgi:acyl-CoA thioester hydrolase
MHPFLANFPVIIEQAVDWADMDGFGHVNNIVYFRYFENARIEYLQRIHWMEDMKTDGIGPIVASTQARFRRAVFFPDTLLVGARLTSMTEDRFTLEHLIVSKKSNEVTTQGDCVVVSYDYRNGKKVPLPAVIRERIAKLEAK